MPERFEGLTSGRSLELDITSSDVLPRIPSDHTMKGFLFARVVEALGSSWDALHPRLLEPPRLGRYLPFGNYPIRDYARLAYDLAQRKHPGLGLAEAVRRLARRDFRVFSETTMGRVMIAMTDDGPSLLMRLPAVFEAVTNAQRVRASRGQDGSVRLEFSEYFGLWTYALGQVEGAVEASGGKATIDADVSGGGRFVLTARVTPG